MDNTTNTNEIIENATEVMEPVMETAKTVEIKVVDELKTPDKKSVIALAVTGGIIVIGGTIYALRKPLAKLGHTIKDKFTKNKDNAEAVIEVDCDKVQDDR